MNEAPLPSLLRDLPSRRVLLEGLKGIRVDPGYFYDMPESRTLSARQLAALVVGGGAGVFAARPIARRLEGRADLARRAFALMVIATAGYVAWRSLG